MTVGEFTNDEITYLRSLRAVARVSNGRIRYTEDFKRDCMKRYAAGESPAKIFRDAGLDSSLIGYKRIERCIARWKGVLTDDALEGDDLDSANSAAGRAVRAIKKRNGGGGLRYRQCGRWGLVRSFGVFWADRRRRYGVRAASPCEVRTA